MRTSRLFLIPALALLVVAAAWTAPVSACPGSEKASSQAACSKSAEAKAAKDDCLYCDFMAELKANSDKVTVTTAEGKNGVTVVFAAVSKDDIEAARTVASKAYSMMATPANCSVSRTKMADKSCDGCKAGLDAFADASVDLEENDMGATAQVTAEDEAQVEKLHAFFKGLEPKEETKG